MVDVRGDVLRPPHGTTPAAVKSIILQLIKISSSFSLDDGFDLDDGFETANVQTSLI